MTATAEHNRLEDECTELWGQIVELTATHNTSSEPELPPADANSPPCPLAAQIGELGEQRKGLHGEREEKNAEAEKLYDELRACGMPVNLDGYLKFVNAGVEVMRVEVRAGLDCDEIVERNQ